MMTSAIFVSSVDISVRVSDSGVCVYISGEDWLWFVCDVLYVCVCCLVARGCDVPRTYINVRNRDVFSVV